MDIEKTFEQKIAQADAKIKDAQQNFGDTEIRDGLLSKAEVYNEYKKYDEAISTFSLALKKTIEIGKKMDINFKLVSIYLELENVDKVKQHIDQCHVLLQKGGDWQRKNKLKVYAGIYNLINRNFSQAAKLFVDVLPTFNCPEVMTYENLVFYAVVTGLISLNRLNLKKKVLDSSQAIVSLLKQPELQKYIESFYYTKYRDFFVSFLTIIQKVKTDKYLKIHSKYFSRETRIIVYSQFLQSYKTVKLQSMASEFGVSANFMDRELSQFIAARRLPCKIDKVSGVIETDPTDQRNNAYKAAVKRGDHLLNQIQKLSRAIDA